MKKIVIATPLYPPDIGGPATYTKLIEEELPKYGFSIEVVSFSSFRFLPKGISHLGYFFKLLVKSYKAQIIYAQDPVSVGFPASLVSVVGRKKLVLKIVGDYAWEQGVQRFGVIDVLDIFSNSNKYGLSVRFLKFIQTFVANRATAIVVPSVYLKNIVMNWGISEQKITVVYNAYDSIDDFEFTRDEARQQLNLNGRIIVSVGRLVPWKGFDSLIEAFVGIKRHISEAKLYIIGGGPDEARLKKIANNLDLALEVIFVGSLNKADLKLYLKSADVFVLNTKYEGFSHQLLEALVLGVPIVTTRVGGNLELIDDNKNGLLVDYGDTKDLIKATLTLLQDKFLANKLIESGFKTVGNFTKNRMLDNLVKVFK